MILADVSLADILWGILVAFFLVVYLMMLFSVIGDLFRSHDLSGGAKALWVVFILIFPFLAMLIYLIVRGGGMAERAITAQRQAQEHLVQYARSVGAGAGGSSAADEIARAKQLLDAGAINADEFDALKRKALS